MRCFCCWRDHSRRQRRPAISSNPEPLDSLPVEPQSRQERLFLLLSIFIGVISGLLVVSFRMAIEWLNVLLLGSSIQPHQLNLIFVPALAGIAIAILTRFVFPQVAGSGINQTKTAMYIHNGYISFRTVIGKFLLSALAIGSGYSLGPEDPVSPALDSPFMSHLSLWCVNGCVPMPALFIRLLMSEAIRLARSCPNRLGQASNGLMGLPCK